MSDKIQTTDNSQLEPKANPEPVEEQENTPAENTTEETGTDVQEFDEAMTEETPAEETVAEETPAEETAAGETPAEEIVAEETPAEETVARETPAEETVAEETPAEETVAEEIPAEETAAGETPAGETVAGETPAGEIVAEETPAEEIVAEETPAEETVARETPAEQIVSEEDEAEEHAGEDDDQDESFIKQLNEISDSSEESEEEEEEEDEHEEPAEKYEDYSREDLLKKLQEVVAEENIQKIKTRVALIRVAFFKLAREEQQAHLDQFLKDGGNRDAYTQEPDPLMNRFDEIFEIYRKNKAKYNEEQEVLKLRNLDAKKQILEELKDLINSEESLKKTYDRFKDLQVQWKDLGLVPAAEINNLWQNYHFLVEKFFDKVKISKELRDLDLKKNLEMKIELCEKAEELLLEPSILKSFKQLQKYHEEWREIGPVPADFRDEIWERFKTATDKINERRRDHYQDLTQQQEENFKAKNELCDQAEQVISVEATTLKDWQESTRKINELFSQWKTIGPAPKKQNDEVWERFRSYLNTFFANKKEYFGKLKQEQLNNYNLKLDICKQAEALKESTDWKNTTRDLINLQKEWKNIGPVPRKNSDKIWKRFRAACDEFFHKKSEYFGSLQKNEKENLEKKLDLIRRVSEHEFGANKSENLQLLKEFQREWMEIGHVPIKEKDKVQKAFREAINHQLDSLNINSSEIRVSEHRPRPESPREYQDRGEVSSSRREMNFLAGKISKLKEDIQLWENNIGFLANSKRAELVRKEFELKIENAKEELASHLSKLKELQKAED